MGNLSDSEYSTSMLRRIALGLHWRWNHTIALTKSRRDKAKVAIRWFKKRKGKPHKLPGPLIVSLTSYPRRFGTLALTLRCLLTQTTAADRTILWIAPEHEAELPAEVIALRHHGLEIRITDHDLGPYDKIIPALRAFPKAFIVTADDDLYYGSRWLEELVGAWDGRHNLIVCHRAHKIMSDANGHPLPYLQWIFGAEVREDSVNLFPTGGGGVLYPPGSLAPDVLDETIFLSLCPRADDIWLYWMGRRAGSAYRTIGRGQELTSWLGSQDVGLFQTNLRLGENDKQIGNMIERFGYPGTAELTSSPVNAQ